MTDAYLDTRPTSEPDAFDVLANSLPVGRLVREDDGWRLESVAPLFFDPAAFDEDLDADEARAAAVEWISEQQSEELDEVFD
jgi:hypothetical protein